MDGFMGYSSQTVFFAILLLVIVGMILYRQYGAPAADEKGVIAVDPNATNPEEEQ